VDSLDNAPPGYYPDEHGTQRYWDGLQWTETTQGTGHAAVTRKPMNRWLLVGIVGVAGLVAGLGIGSLGGGSARTAQPFVTVTDTPRVIATVTVTGPAAPAAAATQAPASGTPKPADFKLTIKVLSKQCFGSAGCNVTFRIDPNYTGPTIPDDRAYQVIYAVRGGEDGTQTNSFTMTGMNAQYDSEEILSTKSSRAKLTAKVTEVLSN